ncbi:MAG TPA: diguanylate cyclase, partial [Mycobacteriales bacterium]
MALRARLIAAVMVAVAVPVVVVIIVLALVLPASAGHATDARVASARAQVEANLQAVCATETSLAKALGAASGNLDIAVVRAAQDQGSAAIVTSAGGTVLSSAARAGDDNAALLAVLPDAHDCGASTVGGPRVIAARAVRKGGGVAVVARALDPSLAGGTSDSLLPTLLRGAGADLTIAFATQDPQPPTATSLTNGDLAARLAARATSGTGPVTLVHTEGATYEVVPLLGGTRLIVSRPEARTGLILLLVILVGLLALVLAALAGWRIGRAATRPLRQLSDAAERVTEGDLDTRLPVSGDDDVARLSRAFNTMTEALRRTITDLRTSRDELQRNVSRLGDTLSSTHDLDRILGVIVDTAMVSVRATAGALLLTSASGQTLYLRVGRGLDGRLRVVPAGSAETNRPVRLFWQRGMPGVAARVAITGEALRGEVGAEALVLAPDEPQGKTVLALPLRSGGRVTGVLALYDRADGQPFDDRDVRIVDSFVAQAVVAVDNVLLHQEAQRLSITDGLTGLWNYRYAILALAREVERAARFGRPLAVLMLDLDRFKRVNDRYGHQRGDAVLIEVANRVRSVVREVDILARYGGEELILVLPETDRAGAVFLAGRIRDALRSKPMGEPGEEELVMTTSVGVAVFPQHGESARVLLRAADSALYAAKAAGRDRCRIAGESPDTLARQPLPPDD